MKTFNFTAVIESESTHGGAYIRIPFDIRKEYGKGRLKVNAAFDGVPYTGSIVNMGLKNPDGSICYILGVRKDIQNQIGKHPGDAVAVTVAPIETGR